MARINLLPWREERRKQRQQEFYVMLALAAGLGLLIFGGAFLYVQKLQEHQEAANEKLRQEIAVLNQRIKKIEELEAERERLLARKNIIEQLQKNRSQIVKLFDQVVRTIPEGVYLTNLTQQGARLTLEGISESNAKVSAYMRNLENSPILRVPELSVTEESQVDGTERYRFTVVVQVRLPDSEDETGSPAP